MENIKKNNNNNMIKTNPPTTIKYHRYYQLEKIRKAKTEDCKQAIPSTPWLINDQQQQQDLNPNIQHLNKDILLQHRPPQKFYNEKIDFHLLIPKHHRKFCLIFNDNNNEDCHEHWWCTCCFCFLCTCF